MGAWASLPGDSTHKALEDAEALAKERRLEDEARRRLKAAIEEQAALLARLAAIRQLLLDMEALDRLDRELGKDAAEYKGVPRIMLPVGEDWQAAHEEFLEAARTPLEDAAFEEFRQASSDLVDEIREAVGIARDRLAPSPELGLDTAMGAAAYLEEAGAWRPDAADFAVSCERDIVAGDTVHFTAQVDALPEIPDGEDVRQVQVVASVVERTTGRWADEDRFTLETLWRSDDGPDGTFAVQLDLLTVGDCGRMTWEREEERIGEEVELVEARAVVWKNYLSMKMTRSMKM